jgi:hypothetical protein
MRMSSPRLGSWVFICPLRGITLVMTVLEKRNKSPGVRVRSGGSLQGSRVVESRQWCNRLGEDVETSVCRSAITGE